MADVYRHSFLIIAASKAGSAFEEPLKEVFENDFGSIHAQVVNHIPNEVSASSLRYFPLLSRGWAYQELLLAPRVLHLRPQHLI
jgi:hypothetical protein